MKARGLIVALVCAGWWSACGVSDRHLQVRIDSATDGSGGAPESGGSPGAETPNEAGTAGAGGNASGSSCGPCPAETPFCEQGQCVECPADASPRCSGATVEVCSDGRWTAREVCAGKTPICGAGGCVALHLTGQFTTQAGPPDGAGSGLRLVDQGFEFGLRTCAKVKAKLICVQGAFVR